MKKTQFVINGILFFILLLLPITILGGNMEYKGKDDDVLLSSPPYISSAGGVGIGEIWRQDMTGSYAFYRAINDDQDNIYIIACDKNMYEAGDVEFLLEKRNSSGSMIFSKKFFDYIDTTTADEILTSQSILVLNNSLYTIWLDDNDLVSANLTKWSLSGDAIWSKTINSTDPSFFLSAYNEEVYVWSYPNITKISEEGGIIWEAEIETSIDFSGGVAGYDNNLYVFGNNQIGYPNEDQDNIVVVKLNLSGEVVQEQSFLEEDLPGFDFDHGGRGNFISASSTGLYLAFGSSIINLNFDLEFEFSINSNYFQSFWLNQSLFCAGGYRDERIWKFNDSTGVAEIEKTLREDSYPDIFSVFGLGDEYFYVLERNYLTKLVLDQTPPIIEEKEDVQVNLSSDLMSVTWQVSDLHPSEYTLFVNRTYKEGADWDGQELTFLLDISEVGETWYGLLVRDKAGNVAQHEFLLTVTVSPVNGGDDNDDGTSSNNDNDWMIYFNIAIIIVIIGLGVFAYYKIKASRQFKIQSRREKPLHH